MCRAMGVEQLGSTNPEDYEAYRRKLSRAMAEQDDDFGEVGQHGGHGIP